jgi:hypothetical protein
MMRLLLAIGAGSLIASATSLIGCGGAGQLPAGQASQPSLLREQAKKNHCTTPCIYVANENSSSVTIYSEKANGNVAPAGSLSGSNTELDEPEGLAFDAANNLYVANCRSNGASGSVTVYSAGSWGNAAPTAEITGQPSGDQMKCPSDVALDAAGDIYVSGLMSNSVSVYAPGANGDPTPIRYISGSNTKLNFPSYLHVTPKGRLYVANFIGKSVNVYAPGANGDVAPAQLITGSDTGIYYASAVTVDNKGRIYVSSLPPASQTACCVTAYAKNANGDAVPIRTISGAQTGLTGADGIGLDSSDNIYVTQLPPSNATPSVTVFKKGATGDVAPIRTIMGSKTGIDGPAGIVVH